MVNNFDFQKAKESSQALTFDFIVAELDLAITFALMAKSANSNEVSARNVTQAKKAYNTANRFLENATLEPYMSEYITTRMARLHKLLEEFP